MFLIVVLQGCGPGDDEVATECILNDDQSATLTGYWRATPVPIAVQAGAFSASEKSAISSAIADWNAFFERSRGYPIFDMGSSGVEESSQSEPASLCQTSFVSGSSFSRKVIIYKRTTGWTGDDAKQKIADTALCYGSTVDGKRTLKSAVIKLNYQHYFTTSQVPDLESIVGHELGHLIGLKHSCEGTAASGVPSCNRTDNEDYLSALLFPVFENGEQRRAPRRNDQERANCLYDPL